MSRKSELVADLGRIGTQLGGAHLTREARDMTFRTFAATMRAQSFGIRSAEQIGGRHLKAFVASRVQEGIGPRTLANQMSHIRAVLEHVGKSGLGSQPRVQQSFAGHRAGLADRHEGATVRLSPQRVPGSYREPTRHRPDAGTCKGHWACAKPKPSPAGVPTRWPDGSANSRRKGACTSWKAPRAAGRGTRTSPISKGPCV